MNFGSGLNFPGAQRYLNESMLFYVFELHVHHFTAAI